VIDGVIMNRWLYRAAGSVGVAGGFLLLAAGSAQADEADENSSPPLDLPTNAGVTEAGQPELLPALPTNLAPLSGLPLSGLPLSELGGLPLGTDAGINPQIGLVPPVDQLVDLQGDLVGLPISADQGVRTLPALVPAPQPAPAEEREELIGAMPSVTRPITGALLGVGSVGELLPIGSVTGLTQQVPLAGPMVTQTARSVPVVADLVPDPMAQQQVPPVIADELAREYSPELFEPQPELLGGGLPLVGPILQPLTGLVGFGNLPAQLPLVGPLVGPVLGGLPVVDQPAPAAEGSSPPKRRVGGRPRSPGRPPPCFRRYDRFHSPT
jgi:hypothetical protein